MEREGQSPGEDERNRSQSEDEQRQGTSRMRNRSSSTPHSSDGSILQKPVIPPILRSSSGPVQSPEEDNGPTASPIKVKRSSILKKKRQDGHGPTVSFELDPALSRAKSSDSNLSYESETGYWSGGSGGSGILKGCKSDSETSSSDGKSILKQRRASLGNLTSEPECNELHSILKRKLSYDSSVLLNCTKSSQFSLSTNSLPTDMSDVSPEPKPILKNKFSSDELLDDNAEEHTQHTPRPILKNGAKRSGTRGANGEPIKPILKRSSHSIESKYDDQSPSGKGILKRSSSNSRRQSGGSDYLDPDDLNHEMGVGFMLNHDDGLESRFRYSQSPHRRAGSTTPKSESEEEIILAHSLAEKRSVLKNMDSASVDRGSRRRHKVKVNKAHISPNSDFPKLDLEPRAQMCKSNASSMPTETHSSATINTKGQLLSSILGQISDNHHARRQQVVNFEEHKADRKVENKIEIFEAHSSSASENKMNAAPNAGVRGPDKSHIKSRITDAEPPAGGAERNFGYSTNDVVELELDTRRLSLNDGGKDENKNA